VKHQLIWLGIGIAALTLACGGGGDETAAQAPGTEAAATGAAAETAPKAVAETAPKAAAATPDVAAPTQDSVTRCLALAAQQNWSEALAPCTQAAKERPTDLRIKHAVQQAEAASAG